MKYLKNEERTTALRLMFLCFILLMLFNYPIISIVNSKVFAGAIPALYLYIFVVWLIAILSTALILNMKNKTEL